MCRKFILNTMPYEMKPIEKKLRIFLFVYCKEKEKERIERITKRLLHDGGNKKVLFEEAIYKCLAIISLPFHFSICEHNT
jgi:hypothetical protein